jgi:hypothetical protein
MTQEMTRAEPAEATLHTVLPPRAQGDILLDLPEPGHLRYQRVVKPVSTSSVRSCCSSLSCH